MRELSLMYLLNLAWRRLWALLGALLIGMAIAFCFCKFAATPIYTARASILVTNGGTITSSDADSNQAVQNGDITASVNLIKTVVELLKKPEIYKQLSDKTGWEYTYSELQGRATIAQSGDDTMFVNVAFTAKTPKEAKEMVNRFVELAPDYIASHISNSQSSYFLAESAENTYPVIGRTMIIAGLAAMVLSYGVVLLVDLFDRAIKGEDDFTSRFEIPLLGVIPDFESATANNYSSKGGYKK